MYTKEQIQISQILDKKKNQERAQQISLLKRNKSPSALSIAQHDTQRKHFQMPLDISLHKQRMNFEPYIKSVSKRWEYSTSREEKVW